MGRRLFNNSKSHLLKITPRNHPHATGQHHARAFDEESGQVYTEKISSGGPMTEEWFWKTNGDFRDIARFKARGPGCASLIDMAIRSVLVNSLNITADSLEGMSWNVAGRLWQAFLMYHVDSVRIWTVFASTFSNLSNLNLNTKQHIILQPNTTFSNYISPLISSSFQWITFLTLSDIKCSRTDLVQLSRVVNLGTLTIDEGVNCLDGMFDDSIIRSWGRAAAESNAFCMLRVLVCRSQQGISIRTFDYLHFLPSLAFFNIQNCNIGSEDRSVALDKGWECVSSKQTLNSLPVNAAANPAWDTDLQAWFTNGGRLDVERISAEGVQAIDSLPLLHISLGGVPPKFNWNLSDKLRMRSYRRVKNQVISLSISTDGSKRIDEVFSKPRNLPRKKPRIRSSKQKSMGAILTEFGL